MRLPDDLAAVLAAQLGVARRAQVVATGVSASTVGRALRAGELVEVLPGIVRLSGRPLSFEGVVMAAQQYCGPASYVTGTTAARFRGLREMPKWPVRLAVRERVRVGTPWWLDVTRTSGIHRLEILEREDGLRIARANLMLLALAHELDDRQFSRAAEDAWHKGLITPASVACYLADHHGSGRRGLSGVARWLKRTGARERPAMTGFELDVIEALVAVGLPEPERQYPLLLPDGRTAHLDVAWPDVRLAVEPGHSWWHGGDEGMRADMSRDRLCARRGWQVIRFDEVARADLRAAALEVREAFDVRAGQLRGPRDGQN